MTGTRRKGSDRRAEIQEVALALFTEHGYDATSMREVAEQLGITKAALYYHFESKEAIILSLFEEHLRTLDELLDWAAEQPHSPELASELLGRWLTLAAARGLRTMRFTAANQTALRTALPSRQGGALQRLEKAVSIMLGPGAPLQDRLRIRMALLSVHSTVMAAQGTEADDADILTAAMQAATLLVEGLLPAPKLPAVGR
ncbi:TetR/AcrR family transcriptional regulator [Streptosporangium sp. NBC_01755]|uniref:TetR/AcrR family transcriptional regulator n=1 Tax=unclassified Streptosporangium TaxID=2632669 RepID=UPI002DD85E96|nr:MULTISPECIES: helix-turn-helix domain-containing protein [unclassified Streptosporangium]WSA27264.1 TetR/AcrR family transcriptional regulator [Streptosporangium sp. NBC_01810]WSD01183.1 TetR/AcrR family transcriptional regulator [Streptosporangium sp. NBC_01755]